MALVKTMKSFVLMISMVSMGSTDQGVTKDEDVFDKDMEGWSLPDRSWNRTSLASLVKLHGDEIIMGNPGDTDKNFVLLPFTNSLDTGSSDWVVSTMTKELVLPDDGELELLFSVLLLGWNTSLPVDATDEKRRSLNPRLQVFYDEDMVFDISNAVEQHKEHFVWRRWNQFKMFSHYREAENITVTVVGSGGVINGSLVALDNIIITITDPSKTGNDSENRDWGWEAPRLEPEAELKENGSWARIETEAEEEAEEEEAEANRGRPGFCVLLPERGPCRLLRKRYFFNSSSGKCEEFQYGGCRGNENRFEDIEGCQDICEKRQLVDPINGTVRSTDFTTFEEGFGGWEVHSWGSLHYWSPQARALGVTPPPLSNLPMANQIGAIPQYHMFDFRQPEMSQQFIVPKGNSLLLEFNLIVKGLGHSGFLSFFLHLDPGFDIYVGNIKVYEFKQHGINDEAWHRYRLTMNDTEVEEHRRESGEAFLLITFKGWLGSGKKGTVVLDNVNITHTTGDPNLPQHPNEQAHLLFPAGTTIPTRAGALTTTPMPTTTSQHPHCLQDRDKGNCKAKFQRYYYSLTADACIQYTYSGCGGNGNNFLTEEDCLNQCIGGGTTLFSKNKFGPNAPTTPANNPQEVCGLAPFPGKCGAKLDRYYFEPKSGECQLFVFSGCQGNLNNFNSKAECTSFCSSVILINGQEKKTPSTTKAPMTTVATTYPSVRPGSASKDLNESSCALEPERGSCNQKLVRYFYDSGLEECNTFIWSGCGGNGNRFNSQSECYNSCQPEEEDWLPNITDTTSSPGAFPKKLDPDENEAKGGFFFPLRFPPFLPLQPKDNSPGTVCSQPQDPGPCKQRDPAKYLRRYFYDNKTASCLPFFYGGCGGNHNNFEEQADCTAFCASAQGTVIKDTKPFNRSSCLKSPLRGSCHLNLQKWFFSRWDNVCKSYNYSGCGANANIFNSRTDCESHCPARVVKNADGPCGKIRNRGDCEKRVERYFFDKEANRCVRFGGCHLGDAEGRENSFSEKNLCREVCLGIKGDSNSSESVSLEAVSQASSAGSAATTVVEIILSLILVGMVGLAAYLGWRHYTIRRGPDTYRMFTDDRSDSIDSGGAPSSGGGVGETFENPTYNNDLATHINRRDSRIEIPALTLGDLGGRQASTTHTDDTFA